MAQTGFVHHVGTFLLFAAAVLLIVTCISAPVVHYISLMRVRLEGFNPRDINFGTFGWCVENRCSPSQVGYNPARVMFIEDATPFSDYAEDTTRALTRAMILHPIACALNFIAFMLALGAGTVGSLLASMVAFVAFLTTVVAMIIDFVLFSIVRSNVLDNNPDARADYGSAAWTILASAICSLIGTVVVFLACCSARLRRRRNPAVPAGAKAGYVAPPPRRRRWF